jgi:hypothetical protein
MKNRAPLFTECKHTAFTCSGDSITFCF